MLYDVECLWPGWTTACEVGQNGVKKSVWCEIAVWCDFKWCDFKCFAVWIYKVMCSIQSSLLFLYYVVFSVMSVQYYLCVSRIQCTQCSVLVHILCRRSMQAVFRVYSISSVS